MKDTLRLGSQLAILMVVAVFAALAPPQACAQQIKIYATIPGIPGSALESGHEGQIEIESVSQGWVAGARRNSCELALTKQLDIAGPLLWLAAATEQKFGEITIEAVRQTGNITSQRFYEVRLENARVSSIATAGASGGGFNESVTLSATTLILSYYPQKPDGSLGAPVTTTIPCK